MVLAGGRARRLGGADKPMIKIGGWTLACAVITAAMAAGAELVVLVGPDRPGLIDELARIGLAGRVELTSERPAGGGPVPALRAGLESLDGADPELVLLLAADLPFLTGEPLGRLVAAVARPADTVPVDAVPVDAVPVSAVPVGAVPVGAVAADGTGRAQWLISCWRADALRAALAGYEGDSLRGLLAPLGAGLVKMTAGPGESGQPPFWLDCDTPEDLAAARKWITRQ